MIAIRETMKRLSLRLTPEEYEHLKQISEVSGLKMEPVLRQLIMGAELRPKPPAQWAAILRQLSGIGTNINQIARVANAYECVRQEDIDSIIKMQNSLWQLVKSL